MKFSAAAFLAAAGFAAAQEIASCTDDVLAFPFCGFAVISATASSLGCTDFNDVVCLCSSSDAIISALSTGTDFSSTCSAQEDPTSDSELSAAYSTLCACVSNTALPTSTSTSSVEATTTTVATSSGAISSPSIGSSSPIVSLPTSSLPVSVPTPGTTTPGVSPTVKPSGSGISSKSVISVSHFTGAAATAGTFLPVGGLFGAVVGLLAYL